MNAWIYKMVALRRRFDVAAAHEVRCESERTYWDRRSRTWAHLRQPSPVLVAGRGPSQVVGRRAGC
jgi:hypothetical protein